MAVGRCRGARATHPKPKPVLAAVAVAALCGLASLQCLLPDVFQWPAAGTLPSPRPGTKGRPPFWQSRQRMEAPRTVPESSPDTKKLPLWVKAMVRT